MGDRINSLDLKPRGQHPKPGLFAQLRQSLRWTRSSYYLMSGFILLLFLIGYVWWPLLDEYLSYINPDYPIWRQIDWLLIGIFLFMSLMIMAQADIKADLPIVLIGLMGGLVIESWGTQTELWVYYTNERPPLWIIPAWPIASLSIDRLFRIARRLLHRLPNKLYDWAHWFIFLPFFGLLLSFTWPTLGKSLTIVAITFCAFLILTTKGKQAAVLTFLAGAGLGYFLELWGTTRLCWTYYTFETPPLFAVLAHGMAAVGFLRVLDLYHVFWPKVVEKRRRDVQPIQ